MRRHYNPDCIVRVLVSHTPHMTVGEVYPGKREGGPFPWRVRGDDGEWRLLMASEGRDVSAGKSGDAAGVRG